MFDAAASGVLGPDSITPAPQSLGGEDFAWYLESIPGRWPGWHQGPGSGRRFRHPPGLVDVDERAIGVGVQADAAHRADRDQRRRCRAGSHGRPGAGLTLRFGNGRRADPVALRAPAGVKCAGLARSANVCGNGRGSPGPSHVGSARRCLHSKSRLFRPRGRPRRPEEGLPAARAAGAVVGVGGVRGANLLDLAIQGHDYESLQIVVGLLAITGLVYACTLRRG